MSDEKQYCECDLRDRQWNGAGRCLTCGNRYIDPRDPMSMPTKTTQVNHMPKGRERPTGSCDCGRIEHGRHHPDCPASGVFYSDKYPAAPPAVGELETGELMRVMEELEKLAAERSLGFVAAAIDQIPVIASATRRLTAANVELVEQRDAAREEAKRLREALEPFVRAFMYVHRDPHADENYPGFREFLDGNEVIPRQMSSEEVLSVGHFRHAALAMESAALSAPAGSQQEGKA